MTASKIEWTGFTWNPIAGCSVISPGCKHCYAMRMARRIELMGGAAHYEGLTQDTKAGAVWTGRVALAPDSTLLAPLRRRKPTMYFVNSMSDLFHEAVPDDWIDRVFAVMALCPQHVFQALTKRSKRMREYMTDAGVARRIYEAACDLTVDRELQVVLIHPDFDEAQAPPGPRVYLDRWPLGNLWLGVSCEDQARADERIPELLATPAAVRFISAEPLLGPIDLRPYLWASNSLENPSAFPMMRGPRPGEAIAPAELLHWVIIGGESGPRARDFRLSWATSLIQQCRDAGVAVFMKQIGSNAWDDLSYVGATPAFKTGDRKGGTPEEWPEDLRVREMPKVPA